MTNPELHEFSVHAAVEGEAERRLVYALTDDEAAVAFLEHHPVGDGDGGVRVYVTDVETGRRTCFLVDADSGQAAPCD